MSLKLILLIVIVLIMMINVIRSFKIQYGNNYNNNIRSLNRLKMNIYTSTFTPYTDSDRISITAKASTSLSHTGDVLVLPFYSNSKKEENLKLKIPKGLSNDLQKLVEEIIDEGIFKADVNQKQLLRLSSSSSSLKYIALVGLGVDPKKGEGDIEVSSANRLGKLVASIAKDVKSTAIGITMPNGSANAGITQFFLGLQEGLYNDNRFKKVPEEGFKPLPLSTVTLLGCSELVVKDISVTYKLTDMIANGVNFARDLVAAPPNTKTPVKIGELAKKIANENKLQCTILGKEECEARKMGGYLGVQSGSMYPPQFIHLTYKPENPSSDVVKIALVGKGLTFDSGGYNIKAGAGSMIELMKFDMGGCGAVLGAAIAIGQLRPKNVEVHFITAVCENMISSTAMKPGDILTASNGKTIEVLNTDAEGRLTLADALVYADNLNVDTIIDLATLTGACIVALGEKVAGLYANDDKLRTDIELAAKRTDEGIWSLPLEPSYKELIKSSMADLKNIGAKGGGSITAALFLQEFVDKAKWAHIDMAGPVWDTTNNKATGYGVKLLVDYVLNAKK